VKKKLAVLACLGLSLVVPPGTNPSPRFALFLTVLEYYYARKSRFHQYA